MKHLKHLLIFLTGGLAVLGPLAASAPEEPLHVLYLGPVEAGGAGRGGGSGFGGSRTNYVYLPGQTLAPEAIYFDHLTSAAGLTEAQTEVLGYVTSTEEYPEVDGTISLPIAASTQALSAGNYITGNYVGTFNVVAVNTGDVLDTFTSTITVNPPA